MANKTISGFPVPFSLPVAASINGTETLPINQTVGGIITTVSSLFSRLLGSLSVTYPTGLVTASAGLTVSGAAFTSRGILDNATTTSVTIAAGRNISISAPTSGVSLSVPSTSTVATATFGNTNLGLNVGLNGGGENIYTTAATLSVGTVGAQTLGLYTNSLLRLSISSGGLIAAPSSPLSATATQVTTALAAFKPTDTTSATNTLTADAALTLTFNETGWYVVDMFLMIFEATSGAGGFQANFLNSGTAGFSTANTQWQFDGFATADIPTTALKQASSAVAAYATVSTTRSGASWMRIKGIVQVISAGTAAVQWAQNSLLAIDPTTLMAGSYVMATKIG